jgi:TPR repeat protein
VHSAINTMKHTLICYRSLMQGHCNAQNTLGAIFMNGHGVKRNQEEGERYVRLSAAYQASLFLCLPFAYPHGV